MFIFAGCVQFQAFWGVVESDRAIGVCDVYLLRLPLCATLRIERVLSNVVVIRRSAQLPVTFFWRILLGELSRIPCLRSQYFPMSRFFGFVILRRFPLSLILCDLFYTGLLLLLETFSTKADL